MKRNRVIALVAAAAAVFPFVVASPGYAATTCQPLLAGPTPSVEVDTNNDGRPEARVPSLTNVRICVTNDVQLSDSPGQWNEQCDRLGTCQRFFIHYGLSAHGSGSAQLCFNVDSVPNCAETVDVPVPISAIRGGTMCIGVDANGGFPCGGGTSVVSFS